MVNTPLTFDEMSPDSKRKVTWRRRKNASHMGCADESPHSRRCPYCSERYAMSETSLHALYPDLAAEMHPTLNGNLIVEQVKPKGDKVIV